MLAPIPLEAPVTTATFPVSFFALIIFSRKFRSDDRTPFWSLVIFTIAANPYAGDVPTQRSDLPKVKYPLLALVCSMPHRIRRQFGTATQVRCSPDLRYPQRNRVARAFSKQ